MRNFGEVDLYVDMTTLPEPFSAATDLLVIEPGSFQRVVLNFSPTVPGAA